MIDLSVEIKKYLIVCRDLKGLSSLSLKAYSIDLKQFCEYMDNRDFASREAIIDYIDHLHKEFKPKSAKRKIASVKSFFRYMEMENIIDENPFHKITIKYKEPLTLPKTIPLHNIKSILSYGYTVLNSTNTKYQKETALRNIVILELLFSTGMRVSEVSNLKVADVDLNSNTICIFGKGSKERIMCIGNKDISNMINTYIKTRSFKSEYVFVNKLGNRYSEQSIRNMVNTYSKAADVNMHITPHMFRHTFATALLDEDVDIRYIQQLLGHSSIVTTQIYTHISTNKIRSILEDKHPRNRFNL